MQFTNCTTRKPLFHHPYESYESYGSWTCIYTPSPSNDMQFTNCTTRKPLFHDPYESYESYGSWTCIYTPSPSNDMQFTNCTTRKPLFHDPYESYESYGSWTCIYTPIPSIDMQFTNCTTRKPLFHDPYESYQLPRYVSWIPDPNAVRVDAFTLDWGTQYNYAFPPFSLIPQVVQKLEEYQAEMVLVAPHWPTQFWFPKLTRLLVQNPVLLPSQPNIVHLPFNPGRHIH